MNKLEQKLGEVYPHEINKNLRVFLQCVVRCIPLANLGLTIEEFLHMLEFDNWNYKQCASVFNCFYSVPLKDMTPHIDSDYSDACRELKRHTDLWNLDIKPIKEAVERENLIANGGRQPMAKA